VQSRVFEGKVIHRQASNNAEIAREWEELSKRVRVDRTVVVDRMVFIAPSPSPSVATATAKAVIKQPKAKFESEDWCIHCRDGGHLVLCSRCPRVFHASCQGLSQAEIRKGFVYCGQHSCASCHRNATAAGGMLFRCRTCPQAFCEDCLPSGDIDAIGDILPEFELLGYGKSTSAYYIKCHDCREDSAQNPDSRLWTEWEAEFREVEKKTREKTWCSCPLITVCSPVVKISTCR